MNAGMLLQLELPLQQYDQLCSLAAYRHQPVSELAQAAMLDWLERQMKLENARQNMRELAHGLGKGQKQTAARDHDVLLYQRVGR